MKKGFSKKGLNLPNAFPSTMPSVAVSGGFFY
jgi:hypothetical protein